MERDLRAYGRRGGKVGLELSTNDFSIKVSIQHSDFCFNVLRVNKSEKYKLNCNFN